MRRKSTSRPPLLLSPLLLGALVGEALQWARRAGMTVETLYSQLKQELLTEFKPIMMALSKDVVRRLLQTLHGDEVTLASTRSTGGVTAARKSPRTRSFSVCLRHYRQEVKGAFPMGLPTPLSASITAIKKAVNVRCLIVNVPTISYQ
jgi:hypothetical protein